MLSLVLVSCGSRLPRGKASYIGLVDGSSFTRGNWEYNYLEYKNEYVVTHEISFRYINESTVKITYTQLSDNTETVYYVPASSIAKITVAE